MVTKTGQFFHIDFAHILGNIMKFGSYKREKAPFVLVRTLCFWSLKDLFAFLQTPEFVFLMGGKESENYNNFNDLCGKAYNALRKYAHYFISLFKLVSCLG